MTNDRVKKRKREGRQQRHCLREAPNSKKEKNTQLQGLCPREVQYSKKKGFRRPAKKIIRLGQTDHSCLMEGVSLAFDESEVWVDGSW